MKSPLSTAVHEGPFPTATTRISGNTNFDRQRVWIRPHYNGFNGLRAIAVFLVFLNHFGSFALPEKIVGKFYFGVDLFFVLSGFLITGILYDSLHDPAFFRNFYTRRALRIFPIFYSFFLLLFVLKFFSRISYERGLLAFFFYAGNLTIPFADIAHHNPTVITIQVGFHIIHVNIGHLWSLCVEEQFYLFWPAVIWAIRSRVRLMKTCVALSVLILCGRICLESFAPQVWLGQYLVRWGTFTRIDTMLIGGWFSLWLRGRTLSTRQLLKLSNSLIAASTILFFLGTYIERHRTHTVFISSVGYTLVALACAGVILRSLDDSTIFSRLLSTRAMVEFGAISYGFYFIHNLFTQAVRETLDRHPIDHRLLPLVPIVMFVLVVILAKLSFRYLESPFLRLKDRLAPQWAASVASESHSSKDERLLHVSEPVPKSSNEL